MEPVIFPLEIQKFIGNRKISIDSMGRSDASVFKIEDTSENLYLKIQNTSVESENSIKLMRWLNDKVPVPKVELCYKEDEKYFIIMTEVKGIPAYKGKNNKNLIQILAQGLKTFQELPIDGCPVTCTIDEKLKLAEEYIRSGEKSDWNEIIHTLQGGHFPNMHFLEAFSSAGELLTWLIAHKPEEELTFSHGDYCLPNIYIDEDNISGFIDLGIGGVASRWCDIVTCIWSLGYNLGEGDWAAALCNALGIESDWQKINYYTLLDQLL